MQKIAIMLGSFFILLVPVLGLAADTGKPVAFLAENVFEFPPVVEGVQIVHEFSIENKGDAPLEILDLKSG